MDYIYLTFKTITLLFIFILIMKIFRIVASYIGNQLGIGEFFIKLYHKQSSWIQEHFKENGRD